MLVWHFLPKPLPLVASGCPVFECRVTREIFFPCLSEGSKLPSSWLLFWTVKKQSGDEASCSSCCFEPKPKHNGVYFLWLRWWNLHFELKLKLIFALIPMAVFLNNIFNAASLSSIFKSRCFRWEGSSWALPIQIVKEKNRKRWQCNWQFCLACRRP